MPDMQEEPAIRAVNLQKTFLDFWRRPSKEALRGVDFVVPRGSVFALLGPNGSGKSTAIKLILGLIFPTSGEISVLGRKPGDPVAKRRIGYLPELTNLHRFLTPRETLLYYSGLFGIDDRTARERAAQLLEMVGLTADADREIGQFSKGMARRVGVAQALVNNPDLIILDEPTSGLDPVGTSEVKGWIGQLSAAGKTILMSSHILADVEDSASHVAILCDGEVRASGTMRELLERAGGNGGTRESPRRARLESFFMDVVEKGRASRLAPFLLGGDGR